MDPIKSNVQRWRSSLYTTYAFVGRKVPRGQQAIELYFSLWIITEQGTSGECVFSYISLVKWLINTYSRSGPRKLVTNELLLVLAIFPTCTIDPAYPRRYFWFLPKANSIKVPPKQCKYSALKAQTATLLTSLVYKVIEGFAVEIIACSLT